MPTQDQVLRTLFSEVRKRIFREADCSLLEHLQLVARLPVETRNALFAPLIAQERRDRAVEQKLEVAHELGDLPIPADYVHAEYMDKMRELFRSRKDVTVIDEWTGVGFTLTSYKPLPSEILSVSVVKQFPEKVSLDDKLQFLVDQEAVFPNAQGLLLVLEHLKEQLDSDVWYASLDEEDRLFPFEDDKYVLTFKKAGGKFLVELQSISHIQRNNVLILCFKRKK